MNNDPLIGRQFANYKIESVLGRGGMAVVYFARDVSLQRPVAVKVIDAQFRQNVSYAQRFISEAQAVATWRHENIIQVFYASQEDDLYYFVMEYIDGLDLEGLLRQYADEGELMPHTDVIRICKAVASALDYAHARDVIHRDIKPSNVMIASDNRVVLTDFGLALDTQQGSLGEVFGTPHYVSPEQARRSADAVSQSDLYSLGVMLYEMLTGLVPFDDPSAASIALQHLANTPPSPRSLNPNLNQSTEEVLLKALEKEPANRYLSGTELMEHLEKALQQPTDKLATAELPPLPPGMVSPQRSLSSQTMMDRVAFHIHSTLTEPKPESLRIPKTSQNLPAIKRAGSQASINQSKPQMQASISQSKPQMQAPSPTETRSMSPMLIGVVLIGVVILLGGLLFASGALNQSAVLPTTIAWDTNVPPTQATIANVGDNQTELTSLPTEVVTNTLIPTAIPIILTETPIPSNTPIIPTETPIPSNTPIIPTETPIPSNTPIIPTETPIPSNTPIIPTETPIPSNTPIVPTATAIPSNTPIPPTVTPPPQLEPTVLYPDGSPVMLYYNDGSFYIWNPTSERIRSGNFKFEALDSNGNRLFYEFDGSQRWTQFYSYIDGGNCVAIEITTGQHLKPAECGNYNSVVQPMSSSDLIFWTGDIIKGFRVLWEDAEVGRCLIEASYCEVHIP